MTTPNYNSTRNQVGKPNAGITMNPFSQVHVSKVYVQCLYILALYDAKFGAFKYKKSVFPIIKKNGPHNKEVVYFYKKNHRRLLLGLIFASMINRSCLLKILAPLFSLSHLVT